MALAFANNAWTTTTSTVNSATVPTFTFTVTSGSLFPQTSTDYFYGTLIDASNNMEIVKCNGMNGGNTVTVTERGVDGTTNRTFGTGSRFELRPVKAAFDDMRDLLTDTNVIKKDGSIAMTGELILANSTPSTALAAGSKGYIDAQDSAITTAYQTADNQLAWMLLGTRSSQCFYQSLTLERTGVSTVQLAAAHMALKQYSGLVAKYFSTINTTINITTSGAGGLDTGSEAASTWYHVYVIGKDDGTVSAVFSTNAASPTTMPSGYTYFGYVGSVYNNSSSDFILLKQINNRVASEATQVLTAGSATVLTSVNAATALPSTAKAMMFRANVDRTVAGSAWVLVGSTSTELGYLLLGSTFTAASDPDYVGGAIPLTAAQTFYYRVAASTVDVDLWVTGWEY